MFNSPTRQLLTFGEKCLENCTYCRGNNSWSDNFLHFHDAFWSFFLACCVPEVDYIYFTIPKKEHLCKYMWGMSQSRKKQHTPLIFHWFSLKNEGFLSERIGKPLIFRGTLIWRKPLGLSPTFNLKWRNTHGRQQPNRRPSWKKLSKIPVV